MIAPLRPIRRLLAAMTLVAAVGIEVPLRAADEPLLLEVEINGYSTGKVGEFMVRNGVLMARPSELRDLGIRSGAALTDEPVSLAAQPGLSARIDAANQVLRVTAATASLIAAQLEIGAEDVAVDTVVSGTGATLDYDVSGSGDGHDRSLSGLFDMRVFAPWGVVSTGVLAAAGNRPGGQRGITVVRLNSTYVVSEAGTQRRYRAGDFISGGLAWTRPVRLGGAQLTSDFSMRPDLVTFPLPSIGGSVAVPSTVDVLVNGSRLFNGQIGAGPFELPRLPVVSGAGTISMTVTDALGRQVVTDLPFYASTALLAPGLQTYAVQAGAVRRNFGVLSNDYGRMATSATWRRGLSQTLTVEATAEATRGTLLAGAGAVFNAGDVALINAALAGSTGSGRSGVLLAIGAQRTGTAFNLGASATLTSRSYRDIAAASGEPVARLQLNANAELALGRFGTLGIAYLDIERDTVPTPLRMVGPQVQILGLSPGEATFFAPTQNAHIATASYSAQVHSIALYATAYRDFARAGGSGFVAGLTIPLGARSSAGVSGGGGSGGRYAQVQVSRSIAEVGDWGYQGFASRGKTNHEFGQVQHKAPWALLTGGVDRIGKQTAVRLGTQGSVSYLDGGVFLSNTITESFAVIDTNGLGGVRVSQENRAAGVTNAGGRVLVPELRSFEINRLSIDPADVPLDSAIAITALRVRPADRSGVIVRFKVRVSHGALLTLLDKAGGQIPIGSTATLASSGITVPVGYDGEAYLEDLMARNQVTIEQPDGRRCTVEFDYKPVRGEIPAIGPLVCKEQGP